MPYYDDMEMRRRARTRAVRDWCLLIVGCLLVVLAVVWLGK